MTREPKIPMSPTELPQQRIHEVVGLPDSSLFGPIRLHWVTFEGRCVL